MAGRLVLSFISIDERLLWLDQFESASVYFSIGSIGSKSLFNIVASLKATFLVTALAEK